MKQNFFSKDNILPICVLFISLILLICMFFSILELVNHLILGVFGVTAYVILVTLISWSIARIIGIKNKLSKSFIVCLSMVAISMLFVTHLTFTDSSYAGSLKECVEYPFSNVTPAGMIFSLLLYPLRCILPLEAVVCTFIILIIIFSCICIDKQHNFKHLKTSSGKHRSRDTEKVEKPKNNIKIQTMKVPNATMEKNKEMPTFISMPLTLNAKMEKERNDIVNDLLKPSYEKTINLKKNEKFETIKNDPAIYEGIISANSARMQFTNNADNRTDVTRPQKILHTDVNEATIIGKPQTILQQKEETDYKPSFDADIKPSETINDNFGIQGVSQNEITSATSHNDTNNLNGINYDELLDLNESSNLSVTENSKDSNMFAQEDEVSNSSSKTTSEDNDVKEKSHTFKKHRKYVFPPLELLTTKSTIPNLSDNTFELKAHTIEEKLEEFKISAKCIGVTRGPAITRYEFEMPKGVPVNKVLQYSNDISMVLESRKAIRIEAPIPGKNAFGIEVPNDKTDTIGLYDLINCNEFRSKKSPLTFALGKDITNRSIMGDIGKLVHTLVAGSTGSGKSVCMNAIIISLLYKASPEDVRIILIDPKYVEFAIYENMPHLLMPNIITEPAQAVNALNWACEEMERRNKTFGNFYVRSIDEYNDMPEVKDGTLQKMYKIVIMVDELNDLMMNARKDVEEKILKLAQKARSCGIHLILATQRPSVDVITGTIKANLPSRIAFSLTNYSDSKTIIDQGGAEKLLGQGDMLYSPRGEEPTRLLGPFVTQHEVMDIVKFVKENNECDFDPEIEKAIMVKRNNNSCGVSPADATNDEYFVQALRWAIESQVCSVSSLQRRFAIGFQRASRLVDCFESHGYISKADGSKPRQIHITMEEFLRLYGNN